MPRLDGVAVREPEAEGEAGAPPSSDKTREWESLKLQTPPLGSE